jgi:hypothetical protein
VQPQARAALDEQQIGTVRALGEQDEHGRGAAAAGGRGGQRVYLHGARRLRELAQPRGDGSAARGHENGPGLTSFAAITGSVGPSP